MREIKKELACDIDVYWMNEFVAWDSRFLPLEQIIFDELPNDAAFPCKGGVSNEGRVWYLDDEAAVRPRGGITNLNMIVPVPVIL